ncbi:MAG: DNA helicase RecQ [bacterium]|nr:DNA helicase RecQ [bacterium]
MKNLLKKHFGYETFRPLQEEIIERILSGGDTLVLMPTGGGKSLCFQLPALTLPGITLVVSPLIALMKDQVDALAANGIAAAFLNSSLTVSEQESVMARARSGDLKILYLAPERIGSIGFSEFLDALDVSLLAIDEAHCISEWGHDFRPEYRKLSDLRKKLPDTPVIALTATATHQVRKDILTQLEMDASSTFVSSFNRENLHYSVRPKRNTLPRLVELLEEQKGESVIIYCFSRKNTEETATALSHVGLPALPYHAGLTKVVRMETQDKFIRDEVPIIVATIAFGMGIDKPDVRLVVHMDLPKSIEGYYQETGRAGRDGLPSECVLYYSYADKRKQDFFINQIENDDERQLANRKLDEVIDYCQNDACRKVYLLNYFGEEPQKETCEACDNCSAPPTKQVDATQLAQKILSAVLRTGERFGSAHVCDVLRGSNKQRIIELGHNDLSVHGIAKDIPMDILRLYTNELRKRGFLEKNPGEYPTLRLSQRGKSALVNNEPIFLSAIESVERPSQRKSGSDLDYDVKLFEKLRILRKEIADRQNVPPFIIFGDRTLQEMAYYFPRTEKVFSQLFGVGKRKQEAFGEEFLACISMYASEHETKERSIAIKSMRQRPYLGLSTTLQETKALLTEKQSIEEISRTRGLSEGTIIQHVEKLVLEDEGLSIDHLRPKEKTFEEIKEAFTLTQSAALTPVFKKLNERFSYDELRLVRLFLER